MTQTLETPRQGMTAAQGQMNGQAAGQMTPQMTGQAAPQGEKARQQQGEAQPSRQITDLASI